MRRSIRSLASIAIFTVFVVGLASVPAAAQAERVLHSFLGGADGIAPYGGVVFDSAGRLYGTTCQGGAHNNGVVYQMAQKSGGVWSEHVIHSFNSIAGDGNCPASSLIVDKSGNVYGTAGGGGKYGRGVVFELSPSTTGGGWGYRILHNFSNNGEDGQDPFGGLVMDSAGNLYGTTQFGPTQFFGTVFELSPTTGGSWKETILYQFPISGGFMVDGAEPQGSLIFDAAGNLYGATNGGGTYGFGTVFELSPSGSGTWNETVLHSFLNSLSSDIWTLEGGVVFDKSGNLYGCTEAGGIDNNGGIFELSPAGGTWTETILHTFTWGTNGSKDGAICNWETPVFDAAGNLYGVTAYGGTNGAGTVWKLAPQSDGTWAYSTVYSFKFTNGDGVNPVSTMAVDSHGYLYGSTLSGGPGSDSGYGTVFVVRP